MRKAWFIETEGKPLEAVNDLITKLWKGLNISRMLLPLKSADENSWQSEEISNPEDLTRSNPFTPLMSENIAQKIPAFQRAYPGEKLAALMRPCELNALKKIEQKNGFSRENLVIFSADCLGTYPSDEFSWRAERKGSQEALTEDAYKFSGIGGFSQYRYRSSCQLCKNPIANSADININITGIPVRRQIMITTYNGVTERIRMADFTVGQASEELVATHDRVSEKMVYRNQQTRARLSSSLTENTELDIDLLAHQLNECGDCQACMDACPICNIFGYSRETDGSLSRQVIADWLVECVGCGMCEQSCSQHKPLAAIFFVVHDQLAKMER